MTLGDTDKGLYYTEKKALHAPISSTSFGSRAVKLKFKPLYGHLIMAYANYNDRTIVVATVDFAISAQIGLLYIDKVFLLEPIFSHNFGRRTFKL